MSEHKKWDPAQPTNYPHAGGCPRCRDAHLCNSCGAGLQPFEACTNGRCIRCHAGVCTPGDRHGYGKPNGTTGGKGRLP